MSTTRRTPKHLRDDDDNYNTRSLRSTSRVAKNLDVKFDEKVEPLPEPEKVGVKCFIRNINQIDTYSQRFFVDMWICSHTTRSKPGGLSATSLFQKSYNRADEIEIFDKKKPVWRLTFMNAEQLTYIYEDNDLPTVRWLEENGVDKYMERQHIQGFFSHPMKLNAFPVDEQHLEIKFALDIGKLFAVFDGEKDVNGKYMYLSCELDNAHSSILENTEWEKISEEVEIALIDGAVEASQYSYSLLTVSVPIRRSPIFYFWTMIVPLIFNFLAGILVLFMKTDINVIHYFLK